MRGQTYFAPHNLYPKGQWPFASPPHQELMPISQFPHLVHNTELAINLLPQTARGSILLLHSSLSDFLIITFVFLMSIFKLLLPSASFQLQNFSWFCSCGQGRLHVIAHLQHPLHSFSSFMIFCMCFRFLLCFQ